MKKRVFSSYLKFSFNYTIFFISYLIPRKKNRWLFSSAFGFSDNAKYFYLDVAKNKDVESYWISNDRQDTISLKNKGVNAVYQRSWFGRYLCLTSKVYIFTHNSGDISYFMSGNAIKVNLWHGLLFKAVNLGVDSKYASSDSRFFNPMKYEKIDVFLQPGPFTFNDFCKMFNIAADGCVKDSYPRCDVFKKSKGELENMIKEENGEQINIYRQIKGKNSSYIYMPTFRDSNVSFFEESGFDLNEINDIMKQQNSLFIIKLHPNVLKSLNVHDSLSNIYIVQTQIDIYPLLPFVDVLVTDYSSIYYDFLLLSKPIILFPYDLEYYISTCRNIIYDYNDTFFGYRCDTIDEFISCLQDRKFYQTDLDYDDLVAKYWYPHTGTLEKRIKKLVKMVD